MPSTSRRRSRRSARTDACEFLLRRENVLLLGNSGTGKTHLALALGLAACQRGHRVRLRRRALVHELMEARDEKRLLASRNRWPATNLLLVDELGFVAAIEDRCGVCCRGFQSALRARLGR